MGNDYLYSDAGRLLINQLARMGGTACRGPKYRGRQHAVPPYYGNGGDLSGISYNDAGVTPGVTFTYDRAFATANDCFSTLAAQVTFNAMKFLTTLDRDEDGVWIAECPAIPGCVSQGATRETALANIREAISACLEVRAERGMPLTVETQQVEVNV